MNLELPKIYPITDSRLSGLSHAEQVRRLIAGGATLIQLREKHASSGDFYDAAKEAVSVARNQGVTILINDRVDIAIAVKADGVHLGQDDLPPAEARKLLGRDAIIGYSTHTIEQVVAALRFPVDYIAFGPIFPTITKQDPDPVVGLELLSQIKGLINERPLVAIGGITRQNLGSVLRAGADSVAIIGDIASNSDEIESRMADSLRMANVVGQ